MFLSKVKWFKVLQSRFDVMSHECQSFTFCENPFQLSNDFFRHFAVVECLIPLYSIDEISVFMQALSFFPRDLNWVSCLLNISCLFSPPNNQRELIPFVTHLVIAVF